MPSCSLQYLADILHGTVYGDVSREITGIASLSRAKYDELSYFDNPARITMLKKTQAGAVLITEGMREFCPVDTLVVANPFLAIAKAIDLIKQDNSIQAGIHPEALIADSAILGKNVSIGANTVIGETVEIGENIQIGTNCVVEAGVRLGTSTRVCHSVVIHKGTWIGENVHIDSGAVIGALPFNAVKTKGVWHSGPAIGGVVIFDHCRIGANTVVDRGSVCDTCLYEGVFLDNLVQIGHDVVIGLGTAVAGCAAIGAHTVLGAHCVIGGASTVGPNLNLTDEVVVTGMSTVSKSLIKAGIYSSGTMVCEHQRWRRNVARFKNLDTFTQRLKVLEKEVFK